jgi:hypothetical protein
MYSIPIVMLASNISPIGAAEAMNIPEILNKAGPKGLHVAEIAKKVDNRREQARSVPCTLLSGFQD